MDLSRTPAPGLRLNLGQRLTTEQEVRLLLAQQAARRLSAAADELAEAAELARIAGALGGDECRQIKVLADEAADAALQARIAAGEDVDVLAGESA